MFNVFRASLHARLHLSELKQLMELSESFSAMAEHCGCKPVWGLRNAIQLQCKSFLDALHARITQQMAGKSPYDATVVADAVVCQNIL
jgi:hypothetical protein